jgi:hypothetical protein
MRRLLLFAAFALVIGIAPQLRAQTPGPLLPGIEAESSVEVVSVTEAVPVAAAAPLVEAVPPPNTPPDATPVAGDGARYFVMVFGAESKPKRARYTHTWATMVKATPDPKQPDAYQLEVNTISWMPRTLVIRPPALRPECGVNLSLEATLSDCFCKNECVCMWGPFEYDPCIAPFVYQRVLNQIHRLNCGEVLYKCIDPDRGPRSRYISDCIHAVTDLDPYEPRPFYNEFQNFGMDASRRVVRIMAGRHRFDPTVTHGWVAEALEVDPRVHRASIE